MTAPRLSDERIRAAIEYLVEQVGHSCFTKSVCGQPLCEATWTLSDLADENRDCRSLNAELVAVCDRLIGAIEAFAVQRSGGPSVNWDAVDASQDAARAVLAKVRT